MNTRKLSAFAAKYKYVLIILLAGLILLLLPTGSRTKAKTAQAAAVPNALWSWLPSSRTVFTSRQLPI